MKLLTALLTVAACVAAMTGGAPTIALAWYDGQLQYRDLMLDAALVFAYYGKCGAGPIPADMRKRAEERLGMAGSSAAAGAKRDVAALINKLGVKKFSDEYRREVTAGENPVVTGDDRPPAVPNNHPGHALDRAKFRVEVKDQAVRERMTALEKVEIRSQDPTAQQALIETIMNRALARGQTLLRTMQADYYDSIRTGAFETARKSLTAENLTAHDVRVEMVLRGSNVANLTTGNRHADADPDSVHIFECSVDRNVGTDPVGIA
jgi:hypothetical protein